jgi:alkylation response protein AidB-like acyl-CoA dehydrogenase
MLTMDLMETVASEAPKVDKEGMFPAASLDALRKAGSLSLVSSPEVGGQGGGMRAACETVERLARECGSTAMIVTMHYCAAAVLEAHGSREVRRAVGEGGKLATLAFSESGSRSHFWVPVSTATRSGENVVLNGQKQMITSAAQADYYVWSSGPMSAEGLSSLYLVPRTTAGLSSPAPFDGLGLRGNGSSPIQASGATVPVANLLGEDGKGFDIMMGVVLPYFCMQSCAVSLGLMEGALERTVRHVTGSSYEYDKSALADIPQVRGNVARMKLKIDLVRSLLNDALTAVETGREDATLRVLEVKLAGGETALEVLDMAMRVCGGAAFRKDVGVERYFRDSRAASVMAPVSDALYDFLGKAVCGMPVFG